MAVRVRIGSAANSLTGRFYEDALQEAGIPAVAEMGMVGRGLDFSQPADIWCLDATVLLDPENIEFIKELLGTDTSDELLEAARHKGEVAARES